MFPRLVTETDVILYCDFHGHNRKNNVFMYGCNTQGDASLKLQERVFPLMMSKNASNKVKLFQTYIYDKPPGLRLLHTTLHNIYGAVVNSFHGIDLYILNTCIIISISSPLRVVSSGCRKARRAREESPCGDWASETATLWRPALEAPRWVSSDFQNLCCVRTAECLLCQVLLSA